MEQQQTDRLLREGAGFWAHVEVMGRIEHFGFVTIEPLGPAAFVRVDIPDKPPTARTEWSFQRAEGDPESAPELWGNYRIYEGPVAGKTVLIGAASIYQITPQAEEYVRQRAGEKTRGEVLRIVREEATTKQIEAIDPSGDNNEASEENSSCPF